CRKADIARAPQILAGKQSRWTSFRGSQSREHHDALTAGFDSQLIQLIPHRLQQAGARVIEHLHPAEESLAEIAALAQERNQRLEALWHVQIYVRLDVV